MEDSRRAIVVLVVCGVVVWLVGWQQHQLYREEQIREASASLDRWLEDNGLQEFTGNLKTSGIRTPEMFADMNIPKFLAKHYSWTKFHQFANLQTKLEFGVTKMQEQLQLYRWLEKNSLEKYYPQLMSQGIQSMKGLSEMDEEMLNKLTTWNPTLTDISILRSAVKRAKQLVESTQPANYRVGSRLFSWIWYLFSWIWFICMVMAKSIMYLIVTMLLLFAGRKSFRRVNQVCQQHKVSLVSYMIGNYLQPQNTKVTWEWADHQVVGETMTFFLKFYRHNRTPYAVCQSSNINIEILHDGILIANSLEFGGNKWREKNKVKVTFTVRQAGEYSIAVLAAGENIRGSPFKKMFLPGPVDPSKCTIVERSSILVVQMGVYSPLLVEARDMFGNLQNITRAQDLMKYKVCITETGSEGSIDPELFVDSETSSNNTLHIKLEQEGCFVGTVSYDGISVNNGELMIISLNEKDWYAVEKNVQRHCYNVWYEATLLPQPLAGNTTPPPSGSGMDGAKKARKVYCYISPRHVSIKEFYMKIIPHKLHSFRVSPRTKFILHPPDPGYEYPLFTLSDGSQPSVSIMCRERNKLVATFSRMVLLNIGGSESFKKKQEFFSQQLLSYQGTRRGEVRLKINRLNLLESSYTACKNMGNDWLKSFNVTFEGEEGLDWGGVRREWFELVSGALFGHVGGLFTRFKEDDPQAPVHPNPRRPPNLKLKYYEFAGRIVGKCLYESAVSSTRRQNVKAKFTRSFLAQLLGLRVSYKYFESDDKDLYRSKIQYIEENDPVDLDLTFAEEEYNSSGRVDKIVDLKPGGRQIAVTQENKMEYLNLVAQYRLVDSAHREIEAFIQGLNEIVPDNLLGIFDEYELELLMCGTGHISVSDMKNHHTVTSGFGGGHRFTKILDWFWTIVSSLTQEELARLVQFITGSSQLPPGGFAELSPQLQISPVGINQALPTAHTCFNQLCLPDYSSFEEMQRKLLIAITEGSEGFGMA